jgi:tetratricopeptide (TPR) repeat protein
MSKKEKTKEHTISFHGSEIKHQHIGNNYFTISTEAEAFGFKLLNLKYFEDHKSTKKDLDDWKNGFPFEIEAIKEKREYRRSRVIDEIESMLESKRSLLIVGESGTSKSTVLKEIICDYIEKEYVALYNYGTEIIGSETLQKFIENLLKCGKKILVAVDDAHNIKSAAVFYLIDQLSRYATNQNLRFILSARLPDFDRFVRDELTGVPETYKQSIMKFKDKSALGHDFRYDLPPFNKKEIEDFIKMFGNSNQVRQLEGISQKIYEDSKGTAIMVKFSVIGQGLEEDVSTRCSRYLENNLDKKAGKIKTMFVCSLLRLGDFDVNDALLEKLQLKSFALALNRATLYRHSEHWDIIHRRWSLEFLSFMLSQSNEEKFEENKELLWSAIESVFKTDEEDAIIAIVISLVMELSMIPLEEVEIKVLAFINNSFCHLSPLTMSKLWQTLGTAWRKNSLEYSNLKKSLEYFDKAIEIDPKDAYSWSEKGRTLVNLNRVDEAMECFNKVVEITPDEPYSWTEKGRFLVDLKRLTEALECYNKAIELTSDESYSWSEKGRILADLERHKEALMCFDKAIEINPTNEYYWSVKGDFLVRLNRVDDALKCFNQCTEINPTDVYSWRDKGRFLADLKRPDDALKCFNQCTEINPIDTSSWRDKGRFFVDLKRLTEALECYNKALEINPADACSWSEKGRILVDLKRPDDALKCFDKAIEIGPTNSYSWSEKGRILVDLKRSDEALLCFDKAIEINPADAYLWTHKGRFLVDLKRTEEALSCFNKAIEINPTNALLWSEKGDFLVDLNRIDEALETYTKAIEINPTKSYYWSAKGRILVDLKRPDEALKCFNKAIEISPMNAYSWSEKGCTLVNLNRIEEAIECYNKAIEINPEDFDLWHCRATLKATQDNIEGALNDLEKAISLNKECAGKPLNNKIFIKILKP